MESCQPIQRVKEEERKKKEEEEEEEKKKKEEEEEEEAQQTKFFRRVPCHTLRDEIINQTTGNEL